MKRFRALALASLAALDLASPAGAAETRFPAASGVTSETLTIASVTDLSAIKPLILAFQKQNPRMAVIYSESTSNTLDARVTAACRAQRFIADLVISSAVAEQVRLVNDGCSQPIFSPAIQKLPDWARWRSELVALTIEPAVIVYNRSALSPSEVPRNRFQLVDLLRQSDRFRGRIGTYDIMSSGVGYLFAFEDAAQATTWGRLLESFGRNSVRTFCCTSEVLDRIADGRLDIGYDVLGSYALARKAEDPRIGVVFPSDYTLALGRAALIPKTAADPSAATRFMEFALSAGGRSILAKKSHLLPSIGGLADLARIAGGDDQSIRPIALSPALLVALDRAKHKMFLDQWRQSIRPVGD